ncbi:MAG TPA: hypothetical protein VGZ26_12950, partial [Pirellulales bacterium]|nr:hypothetical protein [Pirellulales bacterium]
MRRGRDQITAILTWVTLCQALLPGAARGGDIRPGWLTRKAPPANRDCSVETVAKEIDYLEHQIDTYGTVVAKQPDVWGQARLTKHRQEYEQVLQTYLHCFSPTLQASLRRTDQSFLGLALTLNEGGSAPKAAAATAHAAPATNAPSVAIVSQLFPNGLGGSPPAAPSSGSAGGSGGGGGGSSSSGGNPALALIDDNPLTSGSAIYRNAPGMPPLTDFGATNSISLEPTIMLDQLSRYLEHLKELRRINEGDDTADSPGYS